MATSGWGKFFEGAKPGRRTAVTPKSLSANAVKRTVRQTIVLGTGAVSTQTKLVGTIPVAGKIQSITFVGQAAVTGTSITAEVFARTAAGAAGNTLQSAAKDIKFASAGAALTGTAASLTATTANLTLAAGQAFEVVFTATSITAGPGDVSVEIVFVPSEDSESANAISMGVDLL